MNRGFILLWAFVVCIAAVAAGCAAQETASAPQISALAFYQYDASIPIDVEQSELKRTDDFVQYHLWYTSAHEQRVSALLTVPTKVEKPPVVFVQHGYGDSKEVDYVQWPTVFLVQQGYAVISIDAQYHGERKKDNRQQALFNSRSPAMRDAFVQTVIDMRRAVDFLAASDDVDADRLGYLGMSMGAMLGAVFCGVEERVDASCLVVGGGGLARFAGANLDAQGETNLKIIDPVHYAGMISPRPLLMINGRKDTLVPPAAGEALFEAARDPKRIEWYDGGHYDPPLDKVQAWVTEFFAGHVKGS